jgi:hypothetical protein
MDVMLEDVQSQATQVEKVYSQVRDRCEGFVAKATDKINAAVQEAERRTEMMREEMAQWEEEKTRIASTRTFDQTIKLDVGGHPFTTTLATLTRFPDIMLGAMFSGRHALVTDEGGAYYIDRDGTHFREILNYLRAPEAHKQDVLQPRASAPSEIEVEADFYGLKDLMFRPFVPATPVEVKTQGGWKTTVTQDGSGLWYLQGGPCHPYARCLVKVCSTCGWGQPSILSNVYYPDYGVPRFTTGRTIIDAQPRKRGACNWDGQKCTCH